MRLWSFSLRTSNSLKALVLTGPVLQCSAMNGVLAALGAAVAGVVLYANLPTRLTLAFRRMDLKLLASAPLRNLATKETFEVCCLNEKFSG